jgi:uracil-DNA glycosylase
VRSMTKNGNQDGLESAPAPAGALSLEGTLDGIESLVVGCRACPRLVEWRERVGREKRRSFREDDYWARPVPGFGDPAARLLVLGLAPAAHGANRTGRVFTGDRSGDWLYAALHRAGFCNRPESRSRGDGLVLTDAFITAAVKCAPPANRPTTEERDRCHPFLLAELKALSRLRAVLCLGGFAWDQALRSLALLGHPRPAPKPRFGHGAIARIGGAPVLLGSYHPSQQNTFTGRLTREMLDAVLHTAREIIQE